MPVRTEASPPPRVRPRRSRRLLLALLLGAPPLLAGVLWEIHVRGHDAPINLWQVTGRVIDANPLKHNAVVDAFGAYRGRPGIVGTGKTINSAGFISTPETPFVKPPGTLRLLFLGESSTAGTGQDLADADTWPWQVAELLRARHPGQAFDFLNAALGGYTSFESYGRLWSRLRFWEPDVVVVYHGWNEMYYFPRAGSERILGWRTLAGGEWTLERTEKPIRQLEPLWIDHLLRYSQVAIRARFRVERWLGDVAGEVGGAGGAPEREWNRAGPEVFRENLRLLAAACDDMGARLFVGKQATLIVPGLAEEHRRRCRYDYHGLDHDAHLAMYAALYRVVDEEFRAEQILDLTPLSGRPELFADHVHPTVEGSRAFAEVVADVLSRWMEAR